MAARTEEETVARLRRRLGRSSLDPLILDHCREQGWIGDALADIKAGTDPEEAIDVLAAHYRDAESLVRAALERQADPGSRRPPAERVEAELPGDARGAALAEIFSIEAAQLRDVSAFRATVLGGRMLRWEEVADWIGSRTSARQPTPTAHRRRLNDPGRSGSAPPETLTYLLPESRWPHRVIIGADPVLRTLKQVSAHLVNRYGWLESEATTFVLTGITVGLPRARAQVTHYSPWAAASTVTLEISPRTSPADVAAIYRRARQDLLGKGRRSRDLRHPFRAELAVHAFKANGEGSWRRAMEGWNQALPDGAHPYSNSRSFARDCKEAFRAVTGEELEWETQSRSG